MSNAGRQVYIISDLHLGGAAPSTDNPDDRGFRINTHVADLAAFVHALAQKPAPAELVINGDTVDFLAEKNAAEPFWTPFTPDPQAAAAKLDAIAAREKVFFDALNELLERGHKLTILLGNHDVELAFPLVRAKLESIIGVRGVHDYHFVYTNEAYIAGDALIEHGNRYDQFNQIDYDGLREMSSAQSRRQRRAIDIAIPPGSKMVSDVINPIKEHYRFVDLLKPETGAVIPMLLALEPACRARLLEAVTLKEESQRYKLAAAASPSFSGDISSSSTVAANFDISAGDAPPPAPKLDALDTLLAQTLGEHHAAFVSAIGQSVTEIAGDISASSSVTSAFGLARLLFTTNNSANFESRLPALLAAIKSLPSDKSFDRGVETSPEYVDAAQVLALEGGFRYVIFGHTHLPKSIPLIAKPGAAYLNTGTWVDLMRFPSDKLSGSEALSCVRDFCTDLQSGSLRAWIHYEPVFARLDFDDQDHLTAADIHTYTGPDSL